jgi:hypothetical protein
MGRQKVMQFFLHILEQHMKYSILFINLLFAFNVKNRECRHSNGRLGLSGVVHPGHAIFMSLGK